MDETTEHPGKVKIINALGAAIAEQNAKTLNYAKEARNQFAYDKPFDPEEYEVRFNGKRATDAIEIMYVPKGSALGTAHNVPRWLGLAFDAMLKSTKG